MKSFVKVIVFLVFIASFSFSVQAQQKYTDNELQELFQTMERKNLSIAQVVKIINRRVVNSEEITFTVDYTKTADEYKVRGNYGWVFDDFANKSTDRNFSIPSEMVGKKVEISAKLFNYSNVFDINTEDVISDMNKASYRPATLLELLVFRPQFPDLQERFSIIALGSSFCPFEGRNIVLVPYLPISSDLAPGSCVPNFFSRLNDHIPFVSFLGVLIRE